MAVHEGDRRGAIVGLQLCFLSLTILFYSARVYTRVFIVNQFGVDDYLMLIAVVR